MISVGSRDARKGLGLGFGAGREMDDSELEEGEACSSQINEYDPNIDPDVALSYIDDKIQDVLGHFQKDFEGGVSAENLGAKFGGYGSFLPSYQRSPVWSHPRTPAKIQNNGVPKSPNSVKLEGVQRNSSSHAVSHSVGLGTASTSSISLVPPKEPSANLPVRQDVRVSYNQADMYPPEHESAAKKPVKSSDQKTLKVRLKVGSDNLSTRKNDIYSGLGLDGTPSSSLDDTSDSEGISHEPHDTPFESPTSILQIMTSCPLYEGILLSPLPEDLIYLTEKETIAREVRSLPLPRDGLERSGFLVNGTNTTREGGGKVSSARETQPVERNDFSSESKSGNNKDGIGLLAKKDQDIDTFACDELVSKTLKLPLLLNSYSSVSDMTKSKDADKNAVRDKGFPCQAEDVPMEPTSNQEQNWVENREASLAGKVQEERKVGSSNNISAHPKKDGHRKGGESNESAKADSKASKGRKYRSTEVMDHSKQRVSQKGVAHERDDMRLLSGKEQPLLCEKKKLKETPRTPVTDLPKKNSRVGSSSASKVKSTPVNKLTSNGESENFRKDLDKSRDAYRDFFGDEEEENLIKSLQLPSEDKLKESDAVAKSTFAANISSREKPNGKTFDSHPATASNVAQRPGNGLISDADYWVQCEKCLKWRLLPHGITPDILPEKWLCSMLNWLPGMNRCNVTEEETTEKTKALIAQYLVPAPGSQINLPINPGVEGVALANFRHPDQNPQNVGVHAMLSSGKKKNGLKELSKASDKDGSVLLPGSMKKNMQASLKSKSLNDYNQSSPLNEPDFQHLSNSNDLAVEKRKHKYKEKQKGLGSYYDGGQINNLKIKSRRDFDPDTSRAPKKIKSEGRRMTDEEWASDHHGPDGEVGPSSSSGFLTIEAGKDRIKDRLDGATLTKVKDEVCRDNGSADMGNVTRDRPKKRKLRVPEIHVGSFPDCSIAVKEEFSENDCRKEKKARISKSEGKESSASKGNGRTDKKSSHIKKQQSTKNISSRTQLSQNGVYYLKKELGSVQVSVAATSSSSKISGSQKTKSSFQEIKGSPVESVSSSPLRILNPDKHESVPRDIRPKDDSQDAGHFALGSALVSPRRCSDGENDSRNDRYGMARKDKLHSGAYHRSEFSVLDVQDRSGGKARGHTAASPDVMNNFPVNGALDNSGPDSRSPIKTLGSSQFTGEDRENGSHYNAQGSRPRNSGNSYSSRSKGKQSYKSDLDMGKARNSNIVDEQHDHSPSLVIKSRDGNNKLLEKVNKYSETENKSVSKKELPGKSLNESSKRESQSNFGGRDGPDVKTDFIYPKDAISTPKKQPDSDNERSSKKIPPEKHERADGGSTRGRSLPLPPSGAQNELMTCCPRPVPGSLKGGNGADVSQVDGSEGNDAVKVQIRNRKADNQSGTQHISSRHHAQNGHRARDVDAPSPARRDSSTPAYISILKEATDMKHLADRYKNSEANDSTGLYFQAVLKFLHAASLVESPNTESSKENKSMQIYRSTAALCQFCAHEYEKSKDMASATLAFKCLEVAYLKVIYSLHSNAGRDRHELQTALQMVPPGESPSSSASDVDNLNNPSTLDKVPLPKGVSSPQVTGNHVIAARNRPSFVRMLKFTQDVHNAMDASKRSRLAFAAADANMGEAKHAECISSIKRALDFNFQDVEGLLRLVRLAMEAISDIRQKSPDGGGDDINL
ncbi:cysteine-tryptophan domain-containing zinc finger protein 7-like [Argentina anserina]|uniref:cysteine-tryptophan domain-containing zinc finger protein 7-like n=1 Tax=Argentina anserina TaxID=57926 RepID=UPI00217644EE|nr:cysteine-tryptophan domain-containing zinc finger protein 7-like [Potentilla anserina]XP_050366951.1 cysteine-tryptophan domain-containing zinc finger protein 7-like [Potentilla anserina]XP_050366952.1 cysteine-tryptophan domain-containing zinc finger protein 7-like [Potentilla anserina]XP_050366953.1 cysteine-tryptophan domain-containing zinc finger protein 7-like [Potentilla anserina]XP_050366954.1 cysteine-tryptophan domain-containing zinc finger protein 7-like [Potentilla anserina]XP_05